MGLIRYVMLAALSLSATVLAAVDTITLPFHVGQVIYLSEGYAPYDFELRDKCGGSGGGIVPEQHLFVSKAGRPAFDLQVRVPPTHDGQAGDTWQVVKMAVLSPDYADRAGIHAGSSVADFYAAYPQAQAFYAPEYGRLWLENGMDNSIEYDVPGDMYQQDALPVYGAQVTLPLGGFSSDALITRITVID